jgi:hypothetical protein
MRVTLDASNHELQHLGHDAQLLKGDGYFYFTGAETAPWLDRTVRVSTLSALTLEQWVEEFEKAEEAKP